MTIFFDSNIKTGWTKDLPTRKRRMKALQSTDHRMSAKDRFVQAGRRLQALANITKDTRTKMLAKIDARYFFNRAKKL
jgi:hypothetical protein